MYFAKTLAIILISVVLIQSCGGTRTLPKINAQTHQLNETPKLARISDAGIIGGVCTGIAYRFEIPVWSVRAGFLFLSLALGVGMVTYIVLWIFMPDYKTVPPLYEERTS